MATDRDSIEGSPLHSVDFWRERAETYNSRPMLHSRAADAIRDASGDGLRVAEMPFENVEGAVADLFVSDLRQRGFVAEFAHGQTALGIRIRVLRIRF